ncbi:NAD(P) transhydrogenase subunit alpha [Natroniella sulfidigena]|uniref:NAD(P) transhydrogenase subunit alpha n=1 Tax=Natroniella sulfidigena TaxID=723921 RepID=UPI00200AF0BC|nr:NAD(P) transhydrogenase subunit alpha [Natroniella sulfidigena]MCK8817540.1 NAD(P) transhydrogenase subunit alpha [Natroniella sulfidigena]
MKFKGMTIGVPKEIMSGEKRVAVVPKTVKKFVEGGAKVLVEAGAGAGSFIDDQDYSEAGAEIIPNVEDLFEAADLILKVKEPKFNEDLNKHEAELVAEDAVLVSFLHPAHSINHDMVNTLADRNVTSFTLDGIPRISRAQKMDALTSMSTAAGYKASIFAANYLKRFVPMMPTAFGTMKPAEFLVVGTGVAGLQAIGTAKRLGAQVKSIDIRPEANEQARSLGAKVIDFDVPAELAVGEGGYAQQLSDEWYEKEREVLAEHIESCDALILTGLIPGEEAPILVTEDMVNKMKKGSVIVDVAIDQGGNCELTKGGEDYEHNGVFISGLLNIPTTLSVHSTAMFAQNLYSFIEHIVDEGEVDTEADDQIVQESMVTKDGEIVHQGTLKAMG